MTIRLSTNASPTNHLLGEMMHLFWRAHKCVAYHLLELEPIAQTSSVASSPEIADRGEEAMIIR
ncbi:hypothetical protein VW35_19045 [Devosia soli]|uniref:Uncharacterized protein n=1 Tax=Devosia soli TaxID=361041 RepID=A0A0F5L0X4_9HYPH|nr:hypothetical protein VW35_19045 [Devosia soli]